MSLYHDTFGVWPSVEVLPGAGSDRRYLRLSCDGYKTVIATEGDNIEENKAFVALSRAFRGRGHNMPEIFRISEDCATYLQEDLGGVSLFDLLSGPERLPLSASTLKSLARLQTEPKEVWEGCVMSLPFSERQVLWDLNYFKYEFFKPAGISFDENRLEDDFSSFAKMISAGDRRLWGFMYRDCQSRNVMIRDGEPWWIDYQGGRLGPVVYDAVSFLWQAKARFSEEERQALLLVYGEELSRLTGVALPAILAEVERFAAFRTLQVLGAYGFRGLVEKKSHFIESIPDALSNLGSLLEKGVFKGLRELEDVCRKAVLSRFSQPLPSGPLTVKVFSFSYKKGYPEDLSGNGGGFMFDCRGMHNPGRYERYRQLTGLDAEVISFLEERGEVQKFVDCAIEIVAPTVRRYIDRGFSSLQVGFGCTGGRHRSVYCAQSFGKRLSKMFPGLRVEVVHREQDLKFIFENQ